MRDVQHIAFNLEDVRRQAGRAYFGAGPRASCKGAGRGAQTGRRSAMPGGGRRSARALKAAEKVLDEKISRRRMQTLLPASRNGCRYC